MSDSEFFLIQSHVEKVNAVERSMDVNQIWHKDVQAWPVVRCNLAGKVFAFNKVRFDVKRQSPLQSTSVPQSDPSLEIGRLNSLQGTFESISDFQSEPGIPLFFSLGSSYFRLNGQFIDPTIDPFLDLNLSGCGGVKLEFLSEGAKSFLPRKNETLFIQVNGVQNECLRSVSQDVPSAEWTSSFQVLSESIDRVFQYEVNEIYFRYHCEMIHHLSRLIQPILRRLSPPVVFIAKTFNIHAMAVIHACKRLQIKVVDVQHGVQGDFSCTYTHWTRLTELGYQLLPDYYWLWSHRNKQIIESTRSREEMFPKSVVGGHPWMMEWLNLYSGYADLEHKRFLKTLDKYEKIILVSLTWGHDIFPDLLTQVLKASPAGWFWLIRSHPMHKDKNSIQQILDANQFYNAETQKATAYPLYALLQNSQHHVTGWSSVAFEANKLKVPTTLFHPIGKNMFDKEIKQGVFLYASTCEEILNSIRHAQTQKIPEPLPPYIETDLKTARKAYEFICSR